MSAYDETYLAPAQANLGRMLEIATNSLGYELEEFYRGFLVSGLADRFGKGDYELTVGCSGAELAFKVDELIRGAQGQRPKIRYRYDRGPEYWCGWALAHYQWRSTLSFNALERLVPIEEVHSMYPAFHEMDVRQFDDHMDELCKARAKHTPLRIRRVANGLSQSQLARESGVPVRSIQQYEQRQKSLDKAAAQTVMALARVLFCRVEDLLEPATA